jgi:hypothetical protein
VNFAAKCSAAIAEDDAWISETGLGIDYLQRSASSVGAAREASGGYANYRAETAKWRNLPLSGKSRACTLALI